MEQYSILDLALEVYIPGAHGYGCPEGQCVYTVTNGQALLVEAKVKRSRGNDAAPKVKRSRGNDAAPKVNKKRLQRVAMCFAADHPEVEAISFDVLEVIVGSEATLTFNAAKAAFTWER